MIARIFEPTDDPIAGIRFESDEMLSHVGAESRAGKHNEDVLFLGRCGRRRMQDLIEIGTEEALPYLVSPLV